MSVSVIGQGITAHNNEQTFYVFGESVHRVGNRVLFTGLITSPKNVETTTFLINCEKRTYVITETYVRKNGKEQKLKPSPKIYQAYVNSAMWHTMDLICGVKKIYI